MTYGRNPAVIDDLLDVRIVWMESKNTRRVLCNPEKTFGVRNFSMIIRSPNPITLKIFIDLMLEVVLKYCATNTTL